MAPEMGYSLQRAREAFPDATPLFISDNGPQLTAEDVEEFIRLCGLTHVRTSPSYPQSIGKQTDLMTTREPRNLASPSWLRASSPRWYAMQALRKSPFRTCPSRPRRLRTWSWSRPRKSSASIPRNQRPLPSRSWGNFTCPNEHVTFGSRLTENVICGRHSPSRRRGPGASA